jgi:hypothetical protein
MRVRLIVGDGGTPRHSGHGAGEGEGCRPGGSPACRPRSSPPADREGGAHDGEESTDRVTSPTARKMTIMRLDCVATLWQGSISIPTTTVSADKAAGARVFAVIAH